MSVDNIPSKVAMQKRSSCSGSSQQCQTPNDLSSNTTTIAVAVVVPVVACLIVVGFFLWKNYRKGKKEALEDDDPDFNGDNTMLPDYDMQYFHDSKFMSNSIGGGANGSNGDSAKGEDTNNPFNERTESAGMRYPSKTYSNIPKGAQSQSRNQSTFFNHDNASQTNTINAHRYIDSFILPYGEQTGSKKSLDEFAKGIGAQYSAYVPAESPDGSRTSSMSRSVHPFSRSTDALSRTNLSQVVSPNDTDLTDLPTEHSNFEKEKYLDTGSLSTDEMTRVNPAITTSAAVIPTTTAASAVAAASTRPASSKSEANTQITTEDEQFEDTHSNIPQSRPMSSASITTANLVRTLDENIASSSPNATNGTMNRASYVSNGSSGEDDKLDVPDLSEAPIMEEHELDDIENDPTLTTEEREKLRRMKSIYNVYFDRENSVKHKGKRREVILPPLPALPSDQQQLAAQQEGQGQGQEYYDENTAPQQDVEQTPNLTINPDFDRNYASSVYPENPLNDYEPYQQYMQQQQQQGYYQQQPQYQQQQQYYAPPPLQQQQRNLMPKSKPSLSKLNTLPTPSELKQRPYSSINIHTNYVPKSSFKASSSPKIATPPQGFNPLDQWGNPVGHGQGQGQHQPSNLTPTAISRNSVTMTNPTAISGKKAYKPAGSIAQAANDYVRNSPSIMQSPSFANTFQTAQSPISMQSGQFASPTNAEFPPYSNQYGSSPMQQPQQQQQYASSHSGVNV